MESFLNIASWQWWVFGVLLILAEGLVPQAFLIWIGLSAVFTGSVAYLKPELGTFTIILLFILTSGVISSIVTQLGYKRPTLGKKTNKKPETRNQKKAKKSEPLKTVKLATVKSALKDKRTKAKPKILKKNTKSSKNKNKKS